MLLTGTITSDLANSIKGAAFLTGLANGVRNGLKLALSLILLK